MAVRLDPEQNEIVALRNLAGSLAGRRVLEIGSGDGRLTWRFAGEVERVTGLDPNRERVTAALAGMPEALRGRVEFYTLGIEQFSRERAPAGYDVAILSWSL
jgi:predicted RNA methylase